MLISVLIVANANGEIIDFFKKITIHNHNQSLITKLLILKKMNKQRLMDVVKASRRGSREAELENSWGFVAGRKVHKSKKVYCRKNFRIIL